MNDSHLRALLDAAHAKPEGEWSVAAEDRTLTFHVASGGVGLNVAKVTRVKVESGLLYAENLRGELFVLSLAEAFAGSVEGGEAHGRKAGFRT